MERLPPGGKVNVALSDANHFVRNAIYALLQELDAQGKISVSIRNYPLLDDALEQGDIDLVFWSGPESGAGYGCLEYVKEARKKYPKMAICMYSQQSDVLFYVSEHIDACFSLSEPLSEWRNCIIKVINARVYSRKKRTAEFLLTDMEWQVLKAIREGHSLQHIAVKTENSYRKVSALKNSATRKLGLRNKTELLVFLTR
ncbi:LuxR family transcriptional regulator [Enterobacter sp. CC120223-11]|uniref:helix-turn-helix transcriptional regulator n=1 Tax=Enterobacter sp. CC120223-11 TaxID=1378073 RepID=UPI000BCDDC2A|nr:LuxR C-terminal-related transcriptional regulator [Enterobacter sp. CC120223-11]SNY61471.1 regulatory protein, luxR family [Enterobacter sp. CC120223-11]